MTPEEALIELLERVSAGHGAAILVSDQELSQWPDAAVAAMKSQRLLAKARSATSAICPGCERECVMPVHTLPHSTRPASFIVCDQRSDINRVPLPVERLTQWRCSVDAVCRFIADSLGLRRSPMRSASADHWEIGMVRGNKRSQMLCLKGEGILAVVAGGNTMPLVELIGYHDDAYTLDGVMVRQWVDSVNRYTSSNARREVRKLNTQAMYESWQKEYRRLKKKRRHMSDVWYAQQIAKMDIAQGRDADTIRKHMNK